MSNKPQIRFNGHKDGWKESQLKNEVDYTSTGVRACDVSPDGEYDLYDANDVIGKVKTYASDKPYISIIKDGSGVGRVRMLPEYTNCLGTMGCISPKGDNNVNFIFGHIQTKDFKKHIISGAIPHVYFKNYGEDSISLPLPDEQKKIGDFFKALDELIDAKEEELNKLRQLKQALLQQMFPSNDIDNSNGGGYNLLIDNYLKQDNMIVSMVPNAPRIRFKGFTEPWKRMPLSKCVRFAKGRGYSKNDLCDNGAPIILYGTMYTDYTTNITRVDRYAKMKGNSLLSIGNEVIVPASGETAEDIARASAVLCEDVILGGDLNVLYPTENLNASFLALELTYGQSHHSLVKKAQGISVVHLHNSDIEELDILVPEYPEQQLIGKFFREQDNGIIASQDKINKLKTIKQSLLQKMFAA